MEPSLPAQAAEAEGNPKAAGSFLAWWGIIPLIALIIVQVLWGWPIAKARAGATDVVVSYFIGRVIGGPLISLAIAWVIYRLFGRSRLASTIAFSVLLGIFCLSTVKEATAPQPSPIPVVTTFGEFSFEVPAGWINVPPDRESSRAMLLLGSQEWSRAKGMIVVDVGKPAFPTARQLANSFAKSDGRVMPDPVPIDGTEGTRVEIPSDDLNRPRFVVVVVRQDRAYLIMAAATKGTDISGPFDRVLKTWQWNDTHSVSQ